MFALDALVEAYPNAKFLWSHRDPAKVMGSVCSLIQYVRSWSSDRDDPEELGAEQLDSWAEGVRRAMDFRKRLATTGFPTFLRRLAGRPDRTPWRPATSPWSDLHRRRRRSVEHWAAGHKPGSRGAHAYDLADYGLTPEQVRERFAEYLAHLRRRPHDRDTVVRRRRKKLDPDPEVRDAPAWTPPPKSFANEGFAAISIARVLDRAQLSTRAFYRHFDSKDAAGSRGLSGDGAGRDAPAEKENGGRRRHPVDAVAAWIDGPT